MTDAQHNKYGRGLLDRIKYLWDHLSDSEKKIEGKHFRTYEKSSGGSMDIDEYSDLFIKINNIALKNIDRIFAKKFGEHIVDNRHEIDVSEEEWNSLP